MSDYEKSSHAQGQHYEGLAATYLIQHGLNIIQRNYRCRGGEIDIIALDHNTLCFIEVRFRRQQQFGQAAETVDRRKQQRLLQCAKHFLVSHAQYQQHFCRFDVIAITLDSRQQAQYHWLKAAFTE